jgi:hypothetical protein
METSALSSSPVLCLSVLLVLNCVRWLLLRSRVGFVHQQRARLSLEIQALRRQAEVGCRPEQNVAAGAAAPSQCVYLVTQLAVIVPPLLAGALT